MVALSSLGWNQGFQDALDALPSSGVPARVTIEHQDRYTVQTPDGCRDVHLTGKRLQEANQGGVRPAVGDWVVISENGLICDVLPRSSAFQVVKTGSPASTFSGAGRSTSASAASGVSHRKSLMAPCLPFALAADCPGFHCRCPARTCANAAAPARPKPPMFAISQSFCRKNWHCCRPSAGP